MLYSLSKKKEKKKLPSYFFCNESIPYTEYTIFRLVITCSPLQVHRYFKRTHRHNLQGRRIYQVRKLQTHGECLLLVSCSAHSPTLKMGAICSFETTVHSTELQDSKIQNIVLLVTAVRILNHSLYCDTSLKA